jgi:hypothetical protein
MVDFYSREGFGVVSVLGNAGVAIRTSGLIALSVGLVVVAIAARAHDEFAVLALCIAAALLASPLPWEHGYAVLYVPIAAVAPRLTPLWFLPYLAGLKVLWPTTASERIAYGVLAIAVTLIVTWQVLHAPRRFAPAG